MLLLIIAHPAIASVLVLLFILFSLWFLKKMFRFLKAVFHPNRRLQPGNNSSA